MQEDSRKEQHWGFVKIAPDRDERAGQVVRPARLGERAKAQRSNYSVAVTVNVLGVELTLDAGADNTDLEMLCSFAADQVGRFAREAADV